MIPEEEAESPLQPLPPAPCESFLSLPNEIALNCIARISKMYYPSLSLVSKTFRSLISSPELYAERSRLVTTESCLYICLRSTTVPFNPRWFSLWVKPNRNLTDGRIKEKSSGNLFVPLSDPFPPYSNSTVVVGSEIYVIGAPMYDNNFEPSSVVRVYDCRSHTWRDVPNMTRERRNAFACVLDDKIYVIGGCTCYDKYSSWFEMFDIETQTWRNLPTIPDIDVRLAYNWSIDAVEGKIYVKDCRRQGWIYNVLEGRWTVAERRSFTHRWLKYWCVIDDVIYCYSYIGYIWYNVESRKWTGVNGLGAFMKFCCTQGTSNTFAQNMVGLVNYGGKLAVLWYMSVGEKKNIWCAVITLEKCHNGREISGKIEWVDVVLTVPNSDDDLRCLAISI
ncbi:PREDICTED: F-box/kelch-repeat protein At4g29370-like [Camelina sativa]|uniref:F-box/kelch-repeat protein At4g29370-like n=1 Tax=Camelina sativa TaxID=90675 RepID=A0ABM0X4Y2_CAMSA|nr:PREDICTED: F-box/kelch-repeat protein At4g29370-like [Camelina sativa]